MQKTVIRGGFVSTTLALCIGVTSCKNSDPPKPTPSRQAANPQATQTESCTVPVRDFRYQQPGRLVAIGDVHGDVVATRRALLLAGAIDAQDQWIGGDLVLVQTGDILDRGDGEQEILDLFATLESQAVAAGGAIVRLNGNHELMNAMGDFRYVTPGGFRDFVTGKESLKQARANAFAPGGTYATTLAANDLVAVVGDSVFAHGGVLPQFVEGLAQFNRDARCFLLGQHKSPPSAVVDPRGPLWTRAFSQGDDTDCALLSQTLDTLGVSRMVVGHTPQLNGITSACDGKVWRIDTGMASYYRGPTQVLEIHGGQVRALK